MQGENSHPHERFLGRIDKDTGEGAIPSPRKDLQEAQKLAGWWWLCPARMYGLYPWASFLSGFDQWGTLTNVGVGGRGEG